MRPARSDRKSILGPLLTLLCVVLIVMGVSFFLFQSTIMSGYYAMKDGNNWALGRSAVSAESDIALNLENSEMAAEQKQKKQENSAALELAAELEYWNNQAGHVADDLKLSELQALSQSDVIGVRHQLIHLEEDVDELKKFATDWIAAIEELLTSSEGSRIAGDDELLRQFYVLHSRDRLPVREVSELSERVTPLMTFITTLEARTDAAFRPSPMFDTRVVEFSSMVASSLHDYQTAVFKLRRIRREAEDRPTADETLEEALFFMKEQGVIASEAPLYEEPVQEPQEDQLKSPEEEYGQNEQLAFAAEAAAEIQQLNAEAEEESTNEETPLPPSSTTEEPSHFVPAAPARRSVNCRPVCVTRVVCVRPVPSRRAARSRSFCRRR